MNLTEGSSLSTLLKIYLKDNSPLVLFYSYVPCQSFASQNLGGSSYMKKRFNYYLLFLTIILNVIGILFLATFSAPASLKTFGNTNYYLVRQLWKVFLAVILAVIAFKIPLHIFKRWAPVLLLINLLLLVIVFFPVIGSKFWGAQRWLSFAGITFQPSEFLKLTAILYLSAWLSNRLSESRKKDWLSLAKKGYYNLRQLFIPFLFFLAVISIILILQPNISTLGLIVLSLLIMYFAAGTPLWHSFLIIAAGIAGLSVLINIGNYRFERFLVFLHPEIDPLGIGFQVKQSLIAVGSGGIFGKGLGMSSQKFGFLPQAMSDSIFAVFAEETGFLGSFTLIILFLLFLSLGLKIARASNNKFSKLTALGITSWIVIQAVINICSTLGIVPLSGIPLPFFSYGGSHLVAELVGVGILLNISQHG